MISVFEVSSMKMFNIDMNSGSLLFRRLCAQPSFLNMAARMEVELSRTCIVDSSESVPCSRRALPLKFPLNAPVSFKFSLFSFSRHLLLLSLKPRMRVDSREMAKDFSQIRRFRLLNWNASRKFN